MAKVASKMMVRWDPSSVELNLGIDRNAVHLSNNADPRHLEKLILKNWRVNANDLHLIVDTTN